MISMKFSIDFNSWKLHLEITKMVRSASKAFLNLLNVTKNDGQ